jgi:hypothetical protein
MTRSLSFCTFAVAVTLPLLGGCAVQAAEAADLGAPAHEAVAATADALRAIEFASPGTFPMSTKQGDTVPETGCDFYTALTLENAPHAYATLRMTSGPNRDGQTCVIRAMFISRNYTFQSVVVDACGVRTFEGTRVGPAQGTITLIDRRAATCPVAALFPPPADVEVTEVAADGNAVRLFSRLPPPPPQVITAFGQLENLVAIGGETTGYGLKETAGNATVDHELELTADQKAQFVEGRSARVRGVERQVTGVEIPVRTVLKVTEFDVCPAPGTWVNCMPGPGRACDVDFLNQCPGVKIAF